MMMIVYQPSDLLGRGTTNYDIGPHRSTSDHIGSERSTLSSKWPHRTHRDSFSSQKCLRFDHINTRSTTLRHNRPTRRDADPNRPTKQAFFLKTGPNLYSRPYPTHEADGRLSWLSVSFLLHAKYTVSYRIVSDPWGGQFRGPGA